jgi:NADH:ubiquinone reductase (H+-translocating)
MAPWPDHRSRYRCLACSQTSLSPNGPALLSSVAARSRMKQSNVRDDVVQAASPLPVGPRPRVVIVGAGFGGLVCARRLDGAAVDVELLDRGGFHLFTPLLYTPLLYQVATALLDPSDIAYPLRTVFRKSRNVRAHRTTVSSVDYGRQCVQLTTGDEIHYDYLVLATGSTDNYFGNDAVEKASIGLKTLDEAARLRNHVLACLERADEERDPDERRRLLTFVVGGGGPTGVEYSGALGELLHLVAGRDYPEVLPSETRILLVEAGPRLLGGFSERLGQFAERILSRRGIEVRTGTRVETADERSVTLSCGTAVATRTFVWTGGVRPVLPRGNPRLKLAHNQRARVDRYLRVNGVPGVYVIGDAAAAEDGSELPMLSAPAIQQARYVARSILEDAAGRTRDRPFRYFDKGTMATIGRNAAVARLRGGLELTGFLGWLTWIFVHIWYLIGFRNRRAALSSWGWNYVRFDRPIRLILQATPDPLVTDAHPNGNDTRNPQQ